MTLLLIKLAVGIGVVVGLSIIAERLSPRLAGIISGYPTGTAISLFFFGLELGPAFAATSALYNMIGIIAMQVCLYCYYRASLKYGLLLSSIISIGGYGCVIYLLHFLQLTTLLTICLPILSIVLFQVLFKRIPNVTIGNKVSLSRLTIFLRAVCGATIIVSVTLLAKVVGPTWAGLLSAFPTTTFPLLLIVHFTYGAPPVHSIIKNVPLGLIALVVYSLTISLAYPLYGIYWGTLLAFAAATAYLVLYQLKKLTKRTYFNKFHLRAF